MGQKICRCVKADSADDCSSVYGNDGPLQSKPARSNSTDCLPRPVGLTDGDRSARRDGGKKRRFRKWMKGRKAGESATEVAVVPANNSTEGEISLQQVNVEVNENPETLVSEPDGDGNGKRNGVKKKRFWKWRKGQKAGQSATEVAVLLSAVGPADNNTEDDISVQHVNEEVLPTLDRSVSNSSDESFHTPALSLSDLLVKSPVRSVSDSSEDRFYTPTLSLADLLVSVPQSPVRSVSDSSEDSFHTPVLTLTDMLLSIPRPPVHSWSNLSIDSIQTPVRSGSNLSDNVAQPSVSSTMLFKEEDPSVDVEELVDVNFYQYEIGKMLGEGGYGTVYEGTRVEDGLKVAVKFVKKSVDIDYISIPCHPEPLPREIALLILATQGTHIPEIIQLLDWEDKLDNYVMVLERPSSSEDLFAFVCNKGGTVTEALAQIIMWQATKAAYVCFQRGVFHRDIKPDNLLINRDTLDVKLIDFGCGDFLKKSKYKRYLGTWDYRCPEAFDKYEYHAEPATVWTLGVTLYGMLCGTFPRHHTLCQMKNNKWSKNGLSKECCSLIKSCLEEDPDTRIHLKDVLLHKWFQIDL